VVLVRLLRLPLVAAWLVVGLPVRLAASIGRFVGYRRLAVFGLGAIAGLLCAPESGAQLRARLAALVADARATVPDAELAERVRRELGSSSRTWHLAQPEVDASGGVVTLTGTAPHETARGDLERTVAATKGVRHVDNRIEVTGVGPPSAVPAGPSGG
jgi:osmotically-inducible protein OsmY